jgi:transglutaminase-like putative cysteine protease
MTTAWVLGYLRLKGYVSAIVLLVAGILYLALTAGRLWAPLLAFLKTISPLTGEILHCTIWPPLKPLLACGSPQFGEMFNTWKALALTTGVMFTRIGSWFKGVNSGIMVVDPLVAPILWGSAIWLVSAWAGWWVRRRDSVLIGLLPSLALLAYNVYYTNVLKGIYYVVWAAGAMVLLQAASAYLASERHWTSRRMDRVLIEPGLVITVVMLVGVLMLGGALLPSLSIHKINTAIQKLLHPSENRTLAQSLGLQQVVPGANKPGTGGKGPVFLTEIHPVGAGQHLSDQLIMYVSVDGYNPIPPDIARLTSALQPDVTYYWRAQTYDAYNGHVWIANTSQTVSLIAYGAYYPNLVNLPSNYREVTQHIQRAGTDDKILFYTGDLLRADQPTKAEFRTAGDLVDAQTDAQIYTATSRAQYVTVAQLQAAGTNYPDNIRRRYLNLPDELPQRVRDTALNLTADKLSIYDRAKAIETFLRKFPYSLDVPAPPSNRDVADYFLFDLQKGYCDYYATTMVVLARAAGMPARLVTGYSSGEYNYAAHRFEVVAANSHAWVEIYFPGIGWVEFEPTANLSPISHPGEVTNQNNASTSLPTPEPPKKGLGLDIQWEYMTPTLKILGGVLAVLLVLVFTLPLESWSLYMTPADRAIIAIYNRLYRRSHIWGITGSAARTPNEFAVALSARLEPFSKNKKMAPRIQTMIQDVYRLTRLYNLQLFSPFEITREEHKQAVQAWGRMRRGLGRLQRY